MIFIDMEKKPLVEYLDIDEFSYIENDKIKSKLTGFQAHQRFLTWDEGWERVRMIIEKVRDYENNSSNTYMG